LVSFFSKSRTASQPFILFTLFLDVLGIGLIIPVLPALIGQFTQSADQQAHWYGWLAATYGVAQFFFTPLLGALSDRFGRRPLLLLSIFGLGLGFLLQGLATSLMMLLVVRIFSGATAASFVIANAYTADVTPPEERAKAFGMLGAAFGIGFIIGPVVGGILSDINIHFPFYFAASLSLLNWLYGFFFLPESLAADKRAPFSIKRANPFSALAHLGKLRSIGGLVGVFALTVFAQFILQTTWVLYTHFRFDWSPKENGYALFVVGIVSVIVQGGLQSRLLKLLGETRLTLIGITSGVLAFTAYGLATQGWMMYCIIFANFMSFAVAPTLQSIISKAVGESEQGVTQGALSSINSVAIIFAPLLGSALLSVVSHLPQNDWRMGATFYACAAFQLAGLIMAIIHFRRMAKLSNSTSNTVSDPA
jgi:MFS transporter, DHA1 family, tetracycline resistance protein